MTDLYMYRSSLLLVQNSNINVVKMIDCEIILRYMRINIIIYSTLNNNSIGLFLSKHHALCFSIIMPPAVGEVYAGSIAVAPGSKWLLKTLRSLMERMTLE